MPIPNVDNFAQIIRWHAESMTIPKVNSFVQSRKTMPTKFPFSNSIDTHSSIMSRLIRRDRCCMQPCWDIAMVHVTCRWSIFIYTYVFHDFAIGWCEMAIVSIITISFLEYWAKNCCGTIWRNNTPHKCQHLSPYNNHQPLLLVVRFSSAAHIVNPIPLLANLLHSCDIYVICTLITWDSYSLETSMFPHKLTGYWGRRSSYIIRCVASGS